MESARTHRNVYDLNCVTGRFNWFRCIWCGKRHISQPHSEWNNTTFGWFYKSFICLCQLSFGQFVCRNSDGFCVLFLFGNSWQLSTYAWCLGQGNIVDLLPDLRQTAKNRKLKFLFESINTDFQPSRITDQFQWRQRVVRHVPVQRERATSPALYVVKEQTTRSEV